MFPHDQTPHLSVSRKYDWGAPGRSAQRRRPRPSRKPSWRSRRRGAACVGQRRRAAPPPRFPAGACLSDVNITSLDEDSEICKVQRAPTTSRRSLSTPGRPGPARAPRRPSAPPLTRPAPHLCSHVQRFEEARGLYARVQPGDALYIPGGTCAPRPRAAAAPLFPSPNTVCLPAPLSVVEGCGLATRIHPDAPPPRRHDPGRAGHSVVALTPSVSISAFGLTLWQILTTGIAMQLIDVLHWLRIWRWGCGAEEVSSISHACEREQFCLSLPAVGPVR